MACERADITVLVVDDDTITLSVVQTILKAWEYKVVTVDNGYDALKTLREFIGRFDLVITDLHMPGINGFELQKHVKEEFRLPVIMMSVDSRKSVMSKSLESGAVFYMPKPLCPDDFKDIWQHAVAARKVKSIVEKPRREEQESSGEKITFQDVTSDSSFSVNEHKRGENKGKRKGPIMNTEDQCEKITSAAPKKAKVVWTTSLHNRFLMAIRQIGLDKAVPKRILDIMNVPGLTRENIASHLQKYRVFLRKVAVRGETEGLSDTAQRSCFAARLSSSLIKDTQRTIAQLRLPVHQHLRTLEQSGNGGGLTALNLSNLSPSHLYPHDASLSGTSVPRLRSAKLSNYLRRGLNVPYREVVKANSLNQVRHGKSSFVGNLIDNFQQPMLGHYPNSIYQASSLCNPALRSPAFGNMGYGFMNSANSLIGGLNNGSPINYNHGSQGNYSFNYPPSSGNLGPYGCSNLPGVSTHYPSSNYAGIQLNGGSLLAGMDQGRLNSVLLPADIGNNNRFGFINGTPSAYSPLASMEDGNYSGSLREWSASASRAESGSELPPLALITNASQAENISCLSPLSKQLDCLGNAGDDQHHTINEMSEGETNQLENNLTDLFLMLDDMQLLNEWQKGGKVLDILTSLIVVSSQTEENPNGTSEMSPDFFSSYHAERSFDQPQGASDVIVPTTESRVDSTEQSKEPPTCFGENRNQLQGNDEFVSSEPFSMYLEDNAAPEINPATDQDWDLDFLQALFDTK